MATVIGFAFNWWINVNEGGTGSGIGGPGGGDTAGQPIGLLLVLTKAS